jgi:hypothetical protein
MERGESSRRSRASEEVDGSPEVQRHRTDDQAFTGSGRVLNIGGLSTGGLFCIAAMARAGPSEPVVKEAEERELAGTAAMDIKERVDALIKQLEDVDRHGVRTFSILLLFLVSFVLSSDRNGVLSSEATVELEHLRAAVDTFLDFLGVKPGAREECL